MPRRSAGLAFVLASAFAAEPASAGTAPPGTFCADGHVFRMPQQPGWLEKVDAVPSGLELAFIPDGDGAPTRAMGLQVLGSHARRERPASDAGARLFLDRWVDLREEWPSAAASEPLALRHPQHPSAAIHQAGDGAHLYVLAFDPGGHYQTMYLAWLAVQDRAATPSELSELERLAASVEIDLTQQCDALSSAGALALRPALAAPPSAIAPEAAVPAAIRR